MFTLSAVDTQQQKAYGYVQDGSGVSLEDEYRLSGLHVEAAYRLVHRRGEERSSAVVGRHRVDGADVAAVGPHTHGRVERPCLGRAVARPRHYQVACHVDFLHVHRAHFHRR